MLLIEIMLLRLMAQLVSIRLIDDQVCIETILKIIAILQSPILD